MAENIWLKVEREYFTDQNSKKLDVPAKIINKILERYNRFLQKALLGESPFVAEDLKIMLEKTGEDNAGKKDSRSG